MRKTGVTLDEVFEQIWVKDASKKDGKRLAGFAIGGVELPKNDVLTLKAEAEMISNTMLWKLLIKRGYFAAQVFGVDAAKDFYDVARAQGMIKALNIISDDVLALKAFVEPVEKK